jgi:tetratricopeptide (TPR) repeat protein
MPPSKRPRVFISYARKDGAALAQRLQQDLNEQGFDAWLDTRRIQGGAIWTTDIEHALDEAEFVLALMTSGCYVSEICRAEQLRALRKHKCVIPLMAQSGADVPLHLEAKNYRDFTADSRYVRGFSELLGDLHARNGIELKPEFRETSYVTGQFRRAARGAGRPARRPYHRRRWPREAEPLMKRALAIDEKAYGPDHPNVATVLNNLVVLLQATNRLGEAEPLYRRALAIDEESYGPDHPTVATDLNNLATLLYAMNRQGEAEPLMKRALAIYEKAYGPDHPKVATGLNNVANLLQDTNRLAEAEPLIRRALAIDEKSYGPDHPNVARDLSTLAQLLQATNRLGAAEPLMQRALAIVVESYGLDHPEVAIRLNNLAQLLQDTNRLAEAEPLMRRHLEIFFKFTRDTGHEHPHLLGAIGNYSDLLLQMGYTEKQVHERLQEIAAK